MSEVAIKGNMQHLIATHRGAVVNRAERANNKAAASPAGAFGKLFDKKVREIRFSAHAATRMKSRNIALTPEAMNKLENAVSNAAEKGARDSLIMLSNNAFIVNIPNRTVITAMDSGNMKENVFTNIDSAVIVD